MKEQPHHTDPRIAAAAERQMQAWAYAQERTKQGGVALHEPHRLRARVGPYISISREEGAGAEQLARVVAERLGWESMDRNILDEIARRFQLSKPMLELVDETTTNWAYDMLGAWVDRNVIPHEKYLVRLAQVVLTAARHGKVVFVGRGAHFLLPADRGLAVRIVADDKFRIHQVMAERGLTEAASRHWIEQVDRARRQFVEHFFHRNPEDPHLYDLVLRLDRLGVDLAADLIVATAKCKLAGEGGE